LFIRYLYRHLKIFKTDDKGTTALEFCLILPLFAALAFFVLGTGKALVSSIHSASEARTAAWMQARLGINIATSQYRVAASKKAAGMDIQPPLCRDGEAAGEDYLEDRAEDENFAETIIKKTEVSGDKGFFKSITEATTEDLYRAQCEVFDQKTSRLLSDLNVFIVQENAIVPNRVIWQYDETEAGTRRYDIGCGYDNPLYRGFDKNYDRQNFHRMFPDIFPREMSRNCRK